jgi:hypothetical protein
VTEIWLKIKGWPYQVSDLGRVRRDSGGRGTRAGRLRKPCLDTQGYLIVVLCVRAKTRTFRIHRLIAEVFLGPCPKGKEVNHIDGIKTNNYIGNLEYVARSENIGHAWRLNLYKRGQERSDAQLDNRQVLEIRAKYAAGDFFQRELATEYGVGEATVRHILARRSWAHI